MARSKKCEEEFNPWPPFVDVFSSVVLVLLLFILVLIVNVAYYMKFNSKISSDAPKSKSLSDNLYRGVDITEMVTLKKEKAIAKDKGGKGSLFNGGKSDGNAMSVSKDEKVIDQKVKSQGSKLEVEFQDKGIFLTSKIKSKIKSFIKGERVKNKNAKFEISVVTPKNIVGKTMPKQISIGRVLSTKSAMQKMGLKLSDMKIQFKTKENSSKDFGSVIIKVLK